MKAIKPVTVKLDRERTIEFTLAARWRMGQLTVPFALGDLSDRRRAHAAMIAWLWACLVETDAADFPTPESLIEHIKSDAIDPIMDAIGTAVKNARESEKNGNGSTPKPSRSSS